MPDAADPNSLAAAGRGRSMTLGDVPASVRRRYFVDGRGASGLAYYVDATTPTPAFHDRGAKLTAPRNDPQAIRSLVEIATHRGWDVVLVRGERTFRREAWLAGRLQNLDVRGYRPTERDLEDLRRRLAAQRARGDRPERRPSDPGPTTSPPRPFEGPGLRARVDVVETVVRARVRDPKEQDRILAAARSRIAAWLERGADFERRPALGDPQRSVDRARTR